MPAQPFIHQLVRAYCVGTGLEIGPGKLPYCDARRATFVDKHPQASDGMANPDLVADATDLPLPDASQDYVLSSHVLEHAPDTIRTLEEWLRVLKPGGALFLVLPHGDRTFDRRRAKTPLSHHIEDRRRLDGAPDHSHDAEFRAGLEGLEDIEAVTAAHEAAFGKGAMWNFDHRIAHDAMHYHVWTQDEIVRLLQHLDVAICAVVERPRDRPDSFAVVGRKRGPSSA
ncbi:MAG TPA: methyltransferase domain-containing protein [Caulobacteraceae bacterium]|jgi:SAM-dependent methyltransferase